MHLLATVAILAKAPAFIAGIGSTIVTVPISVPLAIAMGVLTLWSGYNAVITTGRPKVPGALAETPLPGLPYTLLQHAQLQFHGPGFCAIAQATICLLSAVRALSIGDIPRFLIFIIFSIGEAATAHLSNLAYHGAHRPAPPFARAWTAIPSSLRQMVLTPGISFATGNLSLILLDLQLQQLTASWGGVVAGLSGVLLLIVGIAVGTTPLYRKQPPSWLHPEYSSSICGIGDIVLGVTTILFGSALTGVATLFWGYSNIILGFIAIEQRKRTSH